MDDERLDKTDRDTIAHKMSLWGSGLHRWLTLMGMSSRAPDSEETFQGDGEGI